MMIMSSDHFTEYSEESFNTIFKPYVGHYKSRKDAVDQMVNIIMQGKVFRYAGEPDSYQAEKEKAILASETMADRFMKFKV
jgi:hypothetical protein